MTWDLPAGDHALDLRANTTDSVRTATLDHDFPRIGVRPPDISMPPDLHHVAVVGNHYGNPFHSYLRRCDVHTGQHLQTVTRDLHCIYTPWFTPDGREVWSVRYHGGPVDGWKIVEDSKSDITELEYLGSTTHQADGPPWQSSCGYQVTGGWWILGPSGKRLFWLPPQWRSYEWKRMWGRRFVVFLDYELPEAVILELE